MVRGEPIISHPSAWYTFINTLVQTPIFKKMIREKKASALLESLIKTEDLTAWEQTLQEVLEKPATADERLCLVSRPLLEEFQRVFNELKYNLLPAPAHDPISEACSRK